MRTSTFAALAAIVLAGLALGACSSSAPVNQQPAPGVAAATGVMPMERREAAKAMAPVPAPAGVPMDAAGVAAPEPEPGQPAAGDFNTEEYRRIVDNPFLDARTNPLSTFSIDVDTASYANVRRFLQENNTLPYPDAVRIEELVNYFPYHYAQPEGPDPVRVGLDLSPAPWEPAHLLLRVSLKAREIPVDQLAPSNLVFLLDTSGSMGAPNKLPLMQRSLEILVDRLRPQDRVAIVAYAGSAGLVLPSTPGNKKETIINAFTQLQAGGSTAGGEGIRLAYQVARENYIKGGNNRVILCTDGDFNVGVSSTSELDRLIEQKRQENVYLTVLGLGMDNYKDDRMETLADKGNGNYAYIDNLSEGQKVLGKEIWGNLFAVAKDVKLQLEFNPAQVKSYRLIGYENRLLAKEDFADDTKDAGEMGSGHTVTAFYELVPAGSTAPDPARPVDDLAFQESVLKPSDDLGVLKLRFKQPGEGNEASVERQTRFAAASLLRPLDSQGDDFRFASAVVEFGMLLRDSPHKASASFAALIARARAAKGEDADGYRAEFVRLAELAQLMRK